MAAVQTELIDSAAAEAFIQLAKTTDKFERYENSARATHRSHRR